jgi:hypothetical protein
VHLYFSNVCADLVNDSFTIWEAVDRRQVFNGSDCGVHTFAVAKIKTRRPDQAWKRLQDRSAFPALIYFSFCRVVYISISRNGNGAYVPFRELTEERHRLIFRRESVARQSNAML